MSYYKYSKDYKKLFELICQGERIPAFVNYRFGVLDSDEPMRDICLIKRRRSWDVDFGVRGVGYGDIMDMDKKKHDNELDAFEKECKRLDVEYIEGVN